MRGCDLFRPHKGPGRVEDHTWYGSRPAPPLSEPTLRGRFLPPLDWCRGGPMWPPASPVFSLLSLFVCFVGAVSSPPENLPFLRRGGTLGRPKAFPLGADSPCQGEMSRSDRGDRDRCPRRGRMRGTVPVMWAVRFPWAAEGGGPYRRGRLMPRRAQAKGRATGPPKAVPGREAQGPPLQDSRERFSKNCRAGRGFFGRRPSCPRLQKMLS